MSRLLKSTYFIPSCMLMSVLCLVACQGKSNQVSSTNNQKQPAKTQKVQKAQKAQATQTAVKEGETFTIVYPTQASAAGKGQQEIKVLAKSGYKVNEGFPSRIQVKNTENLTFVKNETSGKLANTKQLSYTLDFDAKKGVHNVSAKADFSICNDESCQRYSEELAWALKVK